MKISKHNKVALVFKDREINYESLLKKIGYLSKALDVKEGEKTAIFIENRPEWVYSLFSIWNNNNTAVLIDVASEVEDVAYILKDSKPSLVFVSKESKEVMEKSIKEAGIKAKIIDVDSVDFDKFGGVEAEELDYSDRKEDVAVMIYTSGTTGDPKGVMLTFGNLSSNLNSLLQSEIVTPKDTVISILQFHHAYPLMALLLAPLSSGAKNVLIDKVSSEDIFNALQKHKVTLMVGVPRLYTLLAKGILKQVDSKWSTKKIFNVMSGVKSMFLRRRVFKKVQKKFGGHIKCFVSGGARLEPEIGSALETFGFKVIEGYGLTETSPVVSFNTLNNNRIGSVGQPLEDVEVKIKDGEILVKGPNVMKGYYKNEEATNEAIKDGWFHTGDLGSIDKDNFITITGRKKEIIVLPNGKNINPSSIESKFTMTSSYIKEAGVFDNKGFLEVIIFPDFDSLSKDKILNIDETIRWEVFEKYNESAPEYRKIHGYHIVNKELPKTRLGKLRRFLLPTLMMDREKAEDLTPEPEYEEYRLLKEYLSEISEKDITPSKHLELDLGLDSIGKVELQYFLERVFGISIEAEDMAKYMVIKDLAEFVKNNKTKIDKKAAKSSAKVSNNIDLEDIDLDTSGNLIKVAQMLLKPSFKFYFKLDVQGIENFPQGNFILAPNHQSLLDAKLVGSSMPYEIVKETYSLAFYQNFESRIMKYIANNTNVITINIDRNLKEVLGKLEKVLVSGKNLMIFPEGSVTRDGKLLPFKPTFAILSKKLNIPIIPVTIDGARKALPWGAKIPKPSKIRIVFGKPIFPIEEESYEQLSRRVFNKIKREIEKGENDK